MSVRIVVDHIKLQAQTNELIGLSNSVANKRIQRYVTQSQGEIAANLNKTITAMNEISRQMAEAFMKTGSAVGRIELEFGEMDQALAAGYQAVQSASKGFK